MTDFITEQRADVFDNRNSAQQEFADFLENTDDKETDHLVLEISLYGDLDLDVLHKSGFHKVRTLEFIEGQITSIKNLPKSLKTLICANNLLIDLPMASEHLETLDLKSNFLTTADLSGFPALKKINLNFNRLTQLENVPSKIRELYCSDNQIRRIDLEAADQIQILHCSNNPHLLIEHFPTTDSLKDFKMENTQFLEIYRNADLGNASKHTKEHSKKIDYMQALHEYFKMKEKYDTEVHKLKRDLYDKLRQKNTPIRKIKQMISEIQTPCVNCKQPNGTLFDLKSTETGRIYSAICGNRRKPCNLNIQLSTGQYLNMWTSIETTKDFLQEYKEKIIKHKLDVLFNYINETNAASRFKTDLEEYYATKELYEHAVQRYETMYHNPETHEKIREKSNTLFDSIERMDKLVQEHKASPTADSQILKDAMGIYFGEIATVAKQVYQLKYPESRMDYDEDRDMFTLKQSTVTLANMDYSYDESPEVVKYVKL
jgi:D-hexose-6-phosphate mutarotase